MKKKNKKPIAKKKPFLDSNWIVVIAILIILSIVAGVRAGIRMVDDKPYTSATLKLKTLSSGVVYLLRNCDTSYKVGDFVILDSNSRIGNQVESFRNSGYLSSCVIIEKTLEK